MPDAQPGHLEQLLEEVDVSPTSSTAFTRPWWTNCKQSSRQSLPTRLGGRSVDRATAAGSKDDAATPSGSDSETTVAFRLPGRDGPERTGHPS